MEENCRRVDTHIRIAPMKWNKNDTENNVCPIYMALLYKHNTNAPFFSSRAVSLKHNKIIWFMQQHSAIARKLAYVNSAERIVGWHRDSSHMVSWQWNITRGGGGPGCSGYWVLRYEIEISELLWRNLGVYLQPLSQSTLISHSSLLLSAQSAQTPLALTSQTHCKQC
jgi:hypothetical protein